MTVDDLRAWRACNKDALVAQLVRGSYRPRPVRAVDHRRDTQLPQSKSRPGGGPRGRGRPESTTPEQRTRDRGQRSAAAPRRQRTSQDPAAPGATSSIAQYRSCRTVSIYPYGILRITHNLYSLLRFYNLPLIIAHPMNAHNPSIKLRPSPRGWALHFRAIRWPITATFIDTPTTS